MANLCFNSVYLVGEPAVLEKVAEVFKKHEGIQGLEEVQKELGFEAEGWGRSYDEGLDLVDNSNVNNGVLFLTCITAWSAPESYWDALCDKFDLKYTYMAELDGEIWTHNDPDGLWFPSPVILDLEEDFKGIEACNIPFCSEKDLLEYVNESLDQNEPPYLSVWSFEHDLIEAEIGRVIPADKDGKQVPHPDSNMSIEEFEEFIKYHLSTCESQM